MKSKIVMSVFALMSMALVPSTANASTISCGTSERILTITNVSSCAFGASLNPHEGTVAALLGGVWTKEGTIEDSNGTNDLLTVAVTNGSWGPDSDGTFSINPSFWSNWARAALSFHVGQGNGDPDFWVFELVAGSAGGTFDLDRLMGGGGGLSNIVLYGSGTPTTVQTCEGTACVAAVPEPASLTLLGMGLTGIAVAMRRKTAKA